MTPELAAFSDWVLALLPRLFLYPGGLWMLAGLGAIRLAAWGCEGLGPGRLAVELARANLGALAAGWAALALLPLPGAQPLPTRVDTWALAALLAISLLLDLDKAPAESRRLRGLAAAGITLALLAPLAFGQRLLASGEELAANWAAHLAVFAVGLGIVVLAWSGDDELTGQVRGLAWLSMGLAPLWPYLPSGWVTSTLAVFFASTLLWRAAIAARTTPALSPRIVPALATQWLLALVALLVALLLPG
jgi:hypothetical protein